jgi:membrane protease YdiL (CAAX protease family)
MMFESLWPATIGIISFLVFVTIIHADRLWSVFAGFFPVQGSAARVFLDRISGFLFMGLIPLLYIYLTHTPDILYSLILKQPARDTLPFFFLVILFIVIVTAFYSGHKDNLQHYPQIRNKTWPMSIILLDILTWILYLSGYEFLFRGVLIFSILPIFGSPATIIINAILYTLAHFYKGGKEMFAAIPFGLLLAYITVSTQSIWFAFFFHLTLALSNDFFSARALHYRTGFRKPQEK